jgi:hypothetical protein
MKIPPVILPREHGAWAVLIVPALSASILTQSVSVNFFLLVLSTLLVFMSHSPLHVVLREFSDTPNQREKYVQARFWATAYLALAFAFILPVLLRGYQSLIPLGLLALAALAANYFLTGTAPRTIPGDLAAVIGLTLSGPAAYYVLRGAFDGQSFILWIFNFIFFGNCVFYVHTKMKASATKKSVLSFQEKLHLGKYLIAYNVLAASVLLYLFLDHVTPEYSLLAFVPMSTQSILGTLKLSGKVRFRNLGYALLGQAVLFAILLGMLR